MPAQKQNVANKSNKWRAFTVREVVFYHEGESETERTVVRCNTVRKVSKSPK